ncbi:MAG: potassium channel family protein [Actinomycetota bacterium]|nr:potassium channel family protein [Actinomycetota bacterium]
MEATADHQKSHHWRNTHVLPGMTEEQARKARMLDTPTVVVVLLVIPALILGFSEVGGLLGTVSTILNWFIYGWFVFEFLCMLYLAPSDREYFRHNKLDLFVLLTTVPILPGVFQALWVLRLLRLIDVLPVILGRFGSITLLPYAIVLAFIGVFGGGVAFAHFEGISLFDGVYWANTTINTVGYGDVSAQTDGGKLLSMVLQWTGNVILALLIGGVAAAAQRMLLGTASAEVRKDLEEIEEDVEEVAEDVEDIEEDVDNLLKNARNLSETDRVILRELQSIKRRLDETSQGG